jgi:hypothetical protein
VVVVVVDVARRRRSRCLKLLEKRLHQLGDGIPGAHVVVDNGRRTEVGVGVAHLIPARGKKKLFF